MTTGSYDALNTSLNFSNYVESQAQRRELEGINASITSLNALQSQQMAQADRIRALRNQLFNLRKQVEALNESDVHPAVRLIAVTELRAALSKYDVSMLDDLNDKEYLHSTKTACDIAYRELRDELGEDAVDAAERFPAAQRARDAIVAVRATLNFFRALPTYVHRNTWNHNAYYRVFFTRNPNPQAVSLAQLNSFLTLGIFLILGRFIFGTLLIATAFFLLLRFVGFEWDNAYYTTVLFVLIYPFARFIWGSVLRGRTIPAFLNDLGADSWTEESRAGLRYALLVGSTKEIKVLRDEHIGHLQQALSILGITASREQLTDLTFLDRLASDLQIAESALLRRLGLELATTDASASSATAIPQPA